MTMMETKDEMSLSAPVTILCLASLAADSQCIRVLIPAQQTMLIVLGELRSFHNRLITFHFPGNSLSFLLSFICGLSLIQL